MSSPTGLPDDDSYWRRPDPDSGPRNSGAPDAAATPDPATPQYQGPPRVGEPSPHWRPPTISQPPPPRSMPPQDIDALDEAEGSARTVTYGVGMVAAAIAMILVCLLCARVIF